MPNIGQALTRKIGPLPAWGWAVAIGGSLLLVKMLRGGSSSGQNPEVQYVPTGPLPTDATQGFIEGLSGQLAQIQADIQGGIDDGGTIQPVTVTPPEKAASAPAAALAGTKLFNGILETTYVAGFQGPGESQREKRLAAEVIALRSRFPSVASLWQKTTGLVQTAGESHRARENRLAAEAIYLRQVTDPNKPPAISAK